MVDVWGSYLLRCGLDEYSTRPQHDTVYASTEGGISTDIVGRVRAGVIRLFRAKN